MAVNYKAIAKKLKFEGRAFINGKYVNAIDGKKFETINPATGKKLCAVAKCNHKDVDLAVKVSRKAFNSGVLHKVQLLVSEYLRTIKKYLFFQVHQENLFLSLKMNYYLISLKTLKNMIRITNLLCFLIRQNLHLQQR